MSRAGWNVRIPQFCIKFPWLAGGGVGRRGNRWLTTGWWVVNSEPESWMDLLTPGWQSASLSRSKSSIFCHDFYWFLNSWLCVEMTLDITPIIFQYNVSYEIERGMHFPVSFLFWHSILNLAMSTVSHTGPFLQNWVGLTLIGASKKIHRNVYNGSFISLSNGWDRLVKRGPYM